MKHRVGLAILKSKVKTTKKKTEKAKVARKVKKAKKAKEKARLDQTEIPNFDLEVDKPPKRVVNSTDVREWFKDGIERMDFGGKITLPHNGGQWTVHQRSLAKRLLDSYGSDLVKKAVEWLCENWEVLVYNSNGKLSGVPTVGLLWFLRERVFPDAELGIKARKIKRKSNRTKASEYKPEYDDHKDIGW